MIDFIIEFFVFFVILFFIVMCIWLFGLKMTMGFIMMWIIWLFIMLINNTDIKYCLGHL